MDSGEFRVEKTFTKVKGVIMAKPKRKGKTILATVCDVHRRSDIFHIDPEVIEVEPDWNERTDFSGEDEMVESIKENGVIKPLLVQKTSGNRLLLRDGERRLRATKRARREGAEIQSVPVIVLNTKATESDVYFQSLLSNEGKPFTPVEEARAFRRLIGWGFTVEQIAKRLGKSATHVRNRLELAGASPEVQEAVVNREITIGDAHDIVKESEGKIDRQKTELDRRKNRKAPGQRRKLIFSFKGDQVRTTGMKNAACEPIATVLQDDEFIRRIEAAGFDPKTIRISVDRKEAPVN